MQEIIENNGIFTITITDDSYNDRSAEKNLTPNAHSLYLEIYNILRKELNDDLIFYVNPYLNCKEWGLGLRGLNVQTATAMNAFKKLLWITPYSGTNCICISADFLEELQNNKYYSSNLPPTKGHRDANGYFANYKVYTYGFNLTGDWIYIYIDNMLNFDKVIELIKEIGIWNK